MNENNEHVEVEDVVIDDDSLSHTDTIKKLRERLRECESLRDEHLIGWQRARAEMVNFKKSAEEDSVRRVKLAATPILKDLSGILDAFDSALKIEQADGSGLRDGIEQMRNKFEQVLSKHGVTFIYPLAEAFDPNLHEAVGTLPAKDENDDHTVASVIQKGMQLEGMLIRPAKVVIFVIS